MNKLNKLPRKRTFRKYSFQPSFGLCTTTSDPDTLSPSPLTTTHIFKK